MDKVLVPNSQSVPRYYATSDNRRLDFVAILKKWWDVVLIATIAAVLAAQIPHEAKYESVSTMLFKQGGDYVYREQMGNRAPVAGTRSDLRSAINAEGQILTSEDVLLTALQRIGVERYMTSRNTESSFWSWLRSTAGKIKRSIIPASAPQSQVVREQIAVGQFRDNLSVRFVDNSAVLEITHRHANPEIARNLLTEVIDVFLQKRRSIYSDSALPLIKQKLQQVFTDLNEAEAALRRFNEANEVYSIDDERQALLKQKLEAERELDLANLERDSRLVQISSLREQLSEIPESIRFYRDRQINEVLASARQRMVALKLEEKKLLEKYLDRHQKVIEVRSEMEQLQETLDNEKEYTTQTIRSGQNPLFDQVKATMLASEAEIVQLEAKQESLVRLIALNDSRLRKLEGLKSAQREKKSRYEQLDRQYANYIEEVDKAEMLDALAEKTGASARLLQAPSLPIEAIGLSGFMRTALAALLAIAGCMALLIFAELLRRPVSGVVMSPMDENEDGIYRTVSRARSNAIVLEHRRRLEGSDPVQRRA